MVALVDRLTDTIWDAIEKAHREGLNYWEILREIQNLPLMLMMKADAEHHLICKGG